MGKTYLTRILASLLLFAIIGVGPIHDSEANTPVKNELCLNVCPYTTLQKDNIIIDHDIFILSQNKKTKFADWIAYKVTPYNIKADIKTSRNWKKDPKISQKHVLISSDYKGLYKKCNYDRGHQAPLASFKGTDWKKTNYVSNLTPQKAPLNRGPWLKLENKVRDLVKKRNKPVYVITGTYYDDEDNMCELETTRIDYIIPSGYWKVVAVEEEGIIRVASFMFPQSANRKDDYCEYQSNLNKITKISKLEFFDNISEAYPELAIGCN